MLSRRGFAQSLGSVFGISMLAGSTFTLTGCSFSLTSTIESYISIGISAFQAIVNILSAAGVIPPGAGTVIAVAIQAVKAAFADVVAAIQAYNDAPAADKTTLLGKITTALSAVEMELQQFWSDLSIPDSKLGSLIEGLLGVILSTIGAFISQLPPAPAPATTKALRKTIQFTPTKRSARTFRSDFNKMLTSGGYPGSVI